MGTSHFSLSPHSSVLFKGIALLTPGGDLVYCIDPHKQNRWHLQLCVFLQEMLGLSEPPHFLIPCFTATIDRWQDPKTQTIKTFAEVYPHASPHRALLEAAFGCLNADWQTVERQPELCDSLVLSSYQQQFPQLWQTHDLIARLAPIEPFSPLQTGSPARLAWPTAHQTQMQGYVLRLYVSSSNARVERILETLHQLLEEHLRQPYTLKVIDVRKHPEQAEADQITATPTLVKVSPAPIRRIAGALDQPELLLKILSSFERSSFLEHTSPEETSPEETSPEEHG
ncbi:MAG: circadian clock protein KaiB [Cyanobacteria bacterium RM1_2_2]|nr:circadian clock protein KaiB [Cyanobacteria bacterium RM1_2_2]